MLLPLAWTVTKTISIQELLPGFWRCHHSLILLIRKGKLPMEIIQERMGQAAGKCVVDYSFHCTLTDINDKTLEQMTDIVDMGITSFKFYTIYKDDGLYVDDGEILRAFERVRELGASHSPPENGAIVRRKTEDLLLPARKTATIHSANLGCQKLNYTESDSVSTTCRCTSLNQTCLQ